MSETRAPGDHSPEAWAKAMQWPYIWAQVVARAWLDEAFVQRLRADPRLTIAQDLDWDLPDDVDLIVREAHTPTGVTISTTKPVVVMTLPPCPNEYASQAVALADYMAAGRVFPFTCC